MPQLRVEGLPAADARELLTLAVPGHLDPAVADRIVAGTGGNPLALIELGAHLGAEQLAGVEPIPEPLPVGRLLEEHFRQSVVALPPDTLTLLQLMAAAPTDDMAMVWHAAGVLGLPARAAVAAVDAGILNHGAGGGFRHPLIRSSVYAAASGDERRRIHTALAAASDPARVPDRRAWHRAEAVLGTDDSAAADLDAASDWARARGGYSAQALFLSKAAELTTDPARRAERYLAAAQARLASGDHTAVPPLLDLAVPALDRPAARARALRIRATVELFNARIAQVPAMMLDAVAELADADPQTTRELLYEAVHAAVIAGGSVYRTTSAAVAAAVIAAPPEPDDPPWSPGGLIEGLALRPAGSYRNSVTTIRAALARTRDCRRCPAWRRPPTRTQWRSAPASASGRGCGSRPRPPRRWWPGPGHRPGTGRPRSRPPLARSVTSASVGGRPDARPGSGKRRIRWATGGPAGDAYAPEPGRNGTATSTTCSPGSAFAQFG